MGVLSFSAQRVLLVALVAAGCAERPVPEGFSFDPRRLDGEAALEEVDGVVAIGPRDAGTPGAERAARYIADRFREIGLEVRIDTFREPSPAGPETPFHNVIAVLPGSGRSRILIGSHFDTKSGIAEDFAGANDSGSSTGLLIELAETAKASGYGGPGVPDLWFAAFDGEECMVRYGPRDGLHGSRRLAREMVRSGQVPDTRAMILLDMIGDRDLNVTIPRNSDPGLVRLAFDAARAEGVRDRFGWHRGEILDDHVPFLQAGIPAIDLIDFEFGSGPGRNDLWHTAEDSMDTLSAESLGMVGRVTLRMLNELIRPAP